MSFHATSASSPLTSRSSTRGVCRPHPAFKKRLVFALWPYSICGTRNPSSQHVRLSPHVPENDAFSPGSLPRGFGYPHKESLSFSLLGSLFQLPTLIGFALQSLSPSKWSKRSFPLSPPLLHLITKPHDLATVLQRFDPTWKAVPLFAPLRV